MNTAIVTRKTGIVTRSYEELPAGAVAAMLQESSSFSGPIDTLGRPLWQTTRVHLTSSSGWIRLALHESPRYEIEINP